MKAPICSVCLKSDILCRRCSGVAGETGLSENDIKVARALFRLAGKSADGAVFRKSVESGRSMVIICGPGDASKFVGRDGRIVRKLEKEFGKSVKIVEESGDMREFAQSLIYPVQVLGVNTLYRKGTEIVRVIAGSGGTRISDGDFLEVMKAVYRKDIELVFGS